MWLLFYVVLGGVLLQHLTFITFPLSASSLRPISTAVGVGAFVVTLLAGFKVSWRRFLGSVKFAIPFLFFVTFFSVLGTLIVQGISRESFMEIYGVYLTWFFEMFHLEDIFHSFAFSALLGVGAGGVLFALLPLRTMTWSRFAKFLAHLSLLVILAGSSVGSIWGVKGRVGLLEGQSTDRFFVDLPGGKGRKEVALGFELKLENFDIEYHQRRFRLRLFDISREKPRFVTSADPSRERERGKLDGFGVKIIDYWPDHEQIVEAVPLDEKATETAQMVSALGIRDVAGSGRKRWLVSTESVPGGKLSIPGKGTIRFFWSEKEAQHYLDNLSESGEEKHLLMIGDREMEVKVGETYPLPGYELQVKVEMFFQDFLIDMTTRQPVNRSNEPNNPAIKVVLEDSGGNRKQEGWLFANFASFHSSAGDFPLAAMKYRYVPGGTGRGGEIFVVGETREVWSIAGGHIAGRSRLDVSGRVEIADFDVVAVDLLPRAQVVTKNVSRSSEPRNPVVRVFLEEQGDYLLMRAEEPVRLSDDKVLVLSEQQENIKDYRSTLSIVRNGRVIRRQTIEVNSPLSHGGYSIYQAIYDPNRPGWTGLEVVRDPGIPLVYVGLIMMMAGIVLAMLVVPMRQRARSDVTSPQNRMELKP